MGLVWLSSHGFAPDASPACHLRAVVDVYCSQSSLRYFVELDCLQLGEDTSWALSAGYPTGSCQHSRKMTLEHDPPTHPLTAMRARGASRTLTAVVARPARTVTSPGQVSIFRARTRGLCARLVLEVPVEVCAGAATERWVSLVMSIVRCTRPNTLRRAMDRKWAQGHNETTTG